MRGTQALTRHGDLTVCSVDGGHTAGFRAKICGAIASSKIRRRANDRTASVALSRLRQVARALCDHMPGGRYAAGSHNPHHMGSRLRLSSVSGYVLKHIMPQASKAIERGDLRRLWRKGAAMTDNRSQGSRFPVGTRLRWWLSNGRYVSVTVIGYTKAGRVRVEQVGEGRIVRTVKPTSLSVI